MAPERSIDDDLLAAYQRGDFEGFDRFYQRNHHTLFVYLLHRLKSPADAQDALQETFFRIHRSLATYKPDQRALPWVMTIAKNVATDILKKRRVTVALDAEDLPVLPRTAEGFEAQRELEILLSQLSFEDQELLRRRLVEDEAFEVLARDHKTTSANLRQRLSRILKRLRRSDAGFSGG